MNEKKINLGGIYTNTFSLEEIAEQFKIDLDYKKNNDYIIPKTVLSSNGQGVALAFQDKDFKALMNDADIVHPDGMSVVFASKFNRSPLPDRIATTDLVHTISKSLKESDKVKYYLLGASEDTNMKAYSALKQSYPHIEIVGRRDGYFDEEELDSIAEEIDSLDVDILWLGLGKPKQEFIAKALKHKLNRVVWIKTCGGLFEFLAQKYQRAPFWMQKLGLEWLYRVVKDPKKFFYRYMTTNCIAIYAYVFRSER